MKTRSILIIENRVRNTISYNERTIVELREKIKFLKQDTVEKRIVLKKLEEIQEAVQQVGDVVFHEEFIPDFLAKELPFRKPILKSYPDGFVPTYIVSQKKRQKKEFCVYCTILISGEREEFRSKLQADSCDDCYTTKHA